MTTAVRDRDAARVLPGPVEATLFAAAFAGTFVALRLFRTSLRLLLPKG